MHFVADLSQPEQIEALFKQLYGACESLDLLVHNAAKKDGGPLQTLDLGLVADVHGDQPRQLLSPDEEGVRDDDPAQVGVHHLHLDRRRVARALPHGPLRHYEVGN